MEKENTCHHYTLNGKLLGNTDNNQCQAAAFKANRLMGYIKRGLGAHDKNIVLPLYKSLVTPHMEYYDSVGYRYSRRTYQSLSGFKDGQLK
ncbi:hypothetical protein GDO78_017624 [Eleutherodactylus coqui]|uniref:Uncharacterized protein n=1 Tax=Eleutherodactylus coqui TaxID=57060 RepID=A0A8J6BAC4_ELECQ|nr:hypothetical protein GDO78_017624 [Eleutherodactylus coqui]